MELKLTQTINGYTISTINCKIAGGINAEKSKPLPDFKAKKYQNVKSLGKSANPTRDEIYSRRHKLGNIVYPERWFLFHYFFGENNF